MNYAQRSVPRSNRARASTDDDDDGKSPIVNLIPEELGGLERRRITNYESKRISLQTVRMTLRLVGGIFISAHLVMQNVSDLVVETKKKIINDAMTKQKEKRKKK